MSPKIRPVAQAALVTGPRSTTLIFPSTKEEGSTFRPVFQLCPILLKCQMGLPHMEMFFSASQGEQVHGSWAAQTLKCTQRCPINALCVPDMGRVSVGHQMRGAGKGREWILAYYAARHPRPLLVRLLPLPHQCMLWNLSSAIVVLACTQDFQLAARRSRLAPRGSGWVRLRNLLQHLI